ncbi:hypothetical protein [Methyloferula stellata]|uniref:hypothetical protein n=1 Tax=Methyloferula stellata TaxID=876270 RepID=UPI00036749C9|nr:hypothetical protein [Methyloferula stellata]
MSDTEVFLQHGFAALSHLLQEEYGQPLAHWAQMPKWSDAESLQISRALAILMKQPIADAAETDAASNETGARRRWTINDTKIASPEFASSWQYHLLADIENAQEKETGQMAVPADPRRFALFISYERGYFAILAGHLLRLLCDRVKLPVFAAPAQLSPDQPPADEAVLAADLLRQVPGLEQASATFIAGLVFLMSKQGARGFGDWCDERSTAQSDERM